MERKRRSTNLYFSGAKRESKPVNLRPLVYLLIFVAAVFFISRISMFPVKNIEINNNYAGKYLSDLKGLGLFSRELSHKISRIPEVDPLVKEIKCSKGLPSTLSCKAKVRELAGIWKSNNLLYQFDNEGFVYAQTAKADSELLVIDNKNQAVKIGDTVITEQIIDFYLRVKDEASKNDIKLSSFVVNNTFYQFSSQIAGSKVNIIFSTGYSPSDQVKVAKQLLAKNKSVSHIDVRVPSYAYVK